MNYKNEEQNSEPKNKIQTHANLDTKTYDPMRQFVLFC